ncbi:hypothetical protein DERF_009022 [Dermatophagoides farinae]|uniref:Lipase domain-containing protein n=1 Tax=Dermatophagoides farinae TaxID=6954 RepID=A0A922L253_DERFA|nr:hypothetical protein DERF_009022 [Dermatophagoides farinae]
MNLSSSFILIFTMTITFCPLDRAQLLLSLKNSSSSILMANNNRLSTVDSITNDLRIHRQHYSDRRYRLSSNRQKRNSTNTVAMKLSHRIKCKNAIRLLLLRDDQNVIFVGWRSLNELFVAAMIIQSYSLYLARFINFLKSKYHLNGEQIHCIGHSLGGFMCGFAGDITFIGRVTVMDAGPRPYFQQKPPQQRLNRLI